MFVSNVNGRQVSNPTGWDQVHQIGSLLHFRESSFGPPVWECGIRKPFLKITQCRQQPWQQPVQGLSACPPSLDIHVHWHLPVLHVAALNAIGVITPNHFSLDAGRDNDFEIFPSACLGGGAASQLIIPFHQGHSNQHLVHGIEQDRCFVLFALADCLPLLTQLVLHHCECFKEMPTISAGCLAMALEQDFLVSGCRHFFRCCCSSCGWRLFVGVFCLPLKLSPFRFKQSTLFLSDKGNHMVHWFPAARFQISEKVAHCC